jgi:hypothetical protein
MSEKLTRREVLFRKGCRAALAFSVAALLAAPAWAQRGRGAGPPASMPRQSTPPMSQPRMQMPRMSPPPMRPQMPRMPQAPRMPQNMPRNNPGFRPPRPFSHARPPERMPGAGSRFPMNQPRTRTMHPGINSGKFGMPGGAVRRSPAYIPTTRTMMRRPVFTPMTSKELRGRAALIQAFQNRVGQPTYLLPPSSAGYGYGFGPYFPGFSPFGPGFSFFFGDPFLFQADCLGFSPFSSLTFDPYAAEFAYPPFANPFCGGFFSPEFYFSNPFGPFGMTFGSLNTSCPLCSTQQFSLFSLGLDSSFLDALSTPNTTTYSNGALTGLIATPPTQFSPDATTEGNVLAGEGFTGAAPNSSASAPSLSTKAFSMNQPAPSQSLTLVFTNGSTARATRYWLASDGKLHYVTPSGAQMAVPLQQFDMSATMKANRKDGVEFIPPSSSQR